MQRFVRILSICTMSLVLLWLGMLLGPRHLQADVFLRGVGPDNRSAATGSLPGRRLELVLNGSRTQAYYTKLNATPERVIAALKARYRSEDEAADPLQAPLYPVDAQAGGWALYGRVPLFSASDQKPDRAGWVALALDSGAGTDLWRVALPGGAGLFSLLPDGGGEDAAGFDIPDLPPLPGAQRVLSLSLADGSATVALVAYRSHAAQGQRIRHYRQSLLRAGYRPLVDKDNSAGGMLDFERGPSRLTLFLAPPAPDGMAADIIQHRMTGAG